MVSQPKNVPWVFGIEGLDFLGKSTLIEGIRQKLGYYEVIHFSKPQKLSAYAETQQVEGVPSESLQVYHYQCESLRNSMLLAKSGARLIFDRWHLGEAVYAPLYRGYSGDFVFRIEEQADIDYASGVRLILLTEDFQTSRHFVDDGESLGPVNKRMEEQERFTAAFNRSIIRDKRIICVTDPSTGSFKSKEQVLAEALA